MALIRTSPPVTTPVTLAEAKAHCRVDGTDEDDLIAVLIEAATTHVERALRLALITQGWTVALDRWPEGWLVELPLAPVQAVDSVTVYDADDGGAVFDAGNYFLDAASRPPRLVLRGLAPWPQPGRRANGIEIALTAGFGDAAADVPAPLRQALLLLIAHWYERREPVVLEEEPYEVPATVAALLAPWRVVRL